MVLWAVISEGSLITLITINDNTAAVYASHDGWEDNEIVGWMHFVVVYLTQ